MIILINKIINYGQALIVPLVIIILAPIFLAILNMLGVKTYDIIPLIIMIIISLIAGLTIGSKIDKHGYLHGIILGIVLSLIMFLFSLIFDSSYKLSSLIYYLIIVGSTTVGSMIGIQKNIKKN